MPLTKEPLLLGAHISVAGGFDKAVARGESIGCTTLQIFTKSNRQWFTKPIDSEDAHAFKKAVKNSIIQSVVAHCAYLINLGAQNKVTLDKSLRSLQEELERCELLSIPYLIVHPGSCGAMSEQDCLYQIAAGLDQVLRAVPGNTMILLETMAGQGSNLCYTFEHISQIIQACEFSDRIAVCFDTCHAFAAGYDFRTETLYNQLWNRFDAIIGLEKLKVIHINDSKKELGSRVDRHEHIGKGQLGTQPFKLLFNDPRFFAIPKILETPKENLAEDLLNMQTICSLLSPETKNILEVKVVNELSNEAVRK